MQSQQESNIMAQKLKAHTHVNFNNSLHEQVIPDQEEGTVVYSNIYTPSSSASSSSLDGEEHNSDQEGRFQYPQELLGMSWGSYLHSGPPTRVQTSTKVKSGAAVVSDPSVKHNEVTDSSARTVTNRRSKEVHGILRTLQVPVNDDETTIKAIQHTQHPAKSVKLVCEIDKDSERNDSQLYPKLRVLIQSLSDCYAELERYGLETIPMESPNSLLSRLERARMPEGDNNKNTVVGSFSNKLIHDVIEYLEEMIKRLVKQGRKLNEQALFLQRTGKQLGRNQQSFMEEQALLAQAAETAQEQLLIEKVRDQKSQVEI